MTRKTVLITGAARRLGAAIVRDLHSHGMDIVLHYHSSEAEATALAATLNEQRAGSVFPIREDLLAVDFDAIAARATGFTGRLDVLINNASAFYPTAVGETDAVQWEELVGTNLRAPYFLAQACVKALAEAQGCIINITDIHGEIPLKGYPVYSAAKAGLIMLTKALAKELGPAIRVNAISPGAVVWPESLAEPLRKKIISRTLLKRQGTPGDIAGAVRYLIHDAGYMTGQVLTVDGGRTLHS